MFSNERGRLAGGLFYIFMSQIERRKIMSVGYAIDLKWERRVRKLAAEYGYDPDFLIARFEEVMAEDGDIDYFVGVTMERDW